MQRLPDDKNSFRSFLIYFCSWNLLLDLGSLSLLLWFASLYENPIRIGENYVLIFIMCVLSAIRTILYFVLLIIKAIRKKWKQFFYLLAGFFFQIFILGCFLALLLCILAMASIAIGPLN
jgi:hypothetical protein